MENVKNCGLRIANCGLLQSPLALPAQLSRRGGSRTLQNNKNNKRRGLAVLETALVLPLMLSLVIGILEYGYLFLAYQQVTNAARQGARTAILPDATIGQVNTGVANAMKSPLNLGWESDPVITSAGAAVTDLSSLGRGAEVKVQITVAYRPLTSFLPVPSVMKASVIMAKEGP